MEDPMPTDVEDDLSLAFAALADPTRRRILAQLAEGEATPNELAEPFELSQQAIPKHLPVLERAHLISRRQQGRNRPCPPAPARPGPQAPASGSNAAARSRPDAPSDSTSTSTPSEARAERNRDEPHDPRARRNDDRPGARRAGRADLRLHDLARAPHPLLGS